MIVMRCNNESPDTAGGRPHEEQDALPTVGAPPGLTAPPYPAVFYLPRCFSSPLSASLRFAPRCLLRLPHTVEPAVVTRDTTRAA